MDVKLLDSGIWLEDNYGSSRIVVAVMNFVTLCFDGVSKELWRRTRDLRLNPFDSNFPSSCPRAGPVTSSTTDHYLCVSLLYREWKRQKNFNFSS